MSDNIYSWLFHLYQSILYFITIALCVLCGIAQFVTCLAADTWLTADLGVMSSILAQSHTFVEVEHEIISTAILVPSADSRGAVVCYKQRYAHEVLYNC